MTFLDTLDSVRRSRFAAPLAIVAAVLMLAANEISHQRAQAQVLAGQQARNGRVEVNRLLLLMLNAETGARGYLLTGRPDYREPYQQAVLEIETQLARLRQVYDGSKAHAAEARELEELARQKLSVLATLLKLYERGKGEDPAWRELMLTDIGRERMNAFKQLAGRISAQELTRVNSAQDALSSALQENRVGTAALVLLSLIAMMLYLRQTNRFFRTGDEQRKLLQAERDKLESEVQRRTRDLTQTARYLQTVREDERSRLARELHDELGGLLTTAKLDVARLRKQLSAAAPAALERLTHLAGTLDEGIALKRRVIENLRPSALDNLGLKSALEILSTEFADGAGLSLDARIDEVPLGANASLSVYRLVQEALTNVSKYAAAGRVRVRLEREHETVHVAVEDDGRGFEPDALSVGAHGLAGMRIRIESHGGQLEVRSAPGAGTRISAQLPLSAGV